MINILHKIMLLNRNIEYKIIKNCKENIDIFSYMHIYTRMRQYNKFILTDIFSKNSD